MTLTRRPNESVVDLMWSGASAGGSVTVLTPTGRDSITGVDLLRRAEMVAAGLARRGIGRGDRIGVLLPPELDPIACAIGVLRAGATLVPFPPPPRVGARSNWEATLEARRRAAALREFVGPETLSDGRAGPLPDMPRPDDEALISFTSGTTSGSRAVVHTQRSLAAAVHMTDGPADVVARRVSWLPVHQRGWTTDVVKPLGGGTDTVLMPAEAVAARPLRWISAMSEERGTVTSAPSSAYRSAAVALETAAESLDLDLSGWKVARVSSEAIEISDLERFTRSAKRYGFDSQALMAAYGMTEVGAIARSGVGMGLRVDAVDREALSRDMATPSMGGNGRMVVSVGSPFPGVRVEIRDGSGEPLVDRRVGEVVVMSPGAMSGYLGEPDATAEVLVDGWVRTGDLGYRADGELYLVGRVKDTIIIGGRNWYATDIERVVNEVQGVAACAAVATRQGGTDAIALVVEIDDERDHRRAISERLWEVMGLAAADIVVVAPGALPRATGGKLQRSQVPEQFLR